MSALLLSSLAGIASCDRDPDGGGSGLPRSCVVVSDCPAQEVCRQNVCVRVCQSDADCADVGLSCDLAQLVCTSLSVPTAGTGGGGTGGDGSGGSSGQSTAGASGSGGAGGSSGGASGGSSGGAPPAGGDVIDDLEDGDARILAASGRQGPWHVFNDQNGGNQTPAFSSPFAPESGGANGSLFAVHTTGEGYMFAGVGFDLNNAEQAPESPQSQAYDASAFEGLAFRAKGTARLRIEFPMRGFVPRDRGGTCDTECWNVYGQRMTATLGPDWQEYQIPFSAMEREMGGTNPTFDRSQVMSVSFKHEGTGRFDFWIDDVRFYRAAGSGTGGASGAAGSSGSGGTAP